MRQMCESCIHKVYCTGAFCKDHWCGNYVGKDDRHYEVSKMRKRNRVAKSSVKGGQQNNDMR